MKKILLICNAGMSTSLLVTKMEKAAEARGLECVIQAHPFSDMQQYAGNWDVCLIGPQIKYVLKQITKDLEPIPVEVIPPQIYGMADGEKALDLALELAV